VNNVFLEEINGWDDWGNTCEILGMKRAMKLGINIPSIIATSHIEDKYLFRYIIMDYIDGTDARNILKYYSASEKIDFVHQLKENINKMNSINEGSFPTVDVKEKALENTRWDILQVILLLKL